MKLLCLTIILLNDIKMQLYGLESEAFEIPDYDLYFTKKEDLKNRLSRKFAEKKESAERIRQLEENIKNDTEYIDDIPHIDVNSSLNIKHQAATFENNFNSVVGMVGVTYTYKRDKHWRTWREVNFPESGKKVICYRCQNIINETQHHVINDTKHIHNTDCHVGGYWAIEEVVPSCTFEILSFKDEKHLCVVNFWQLGDKNLSSCPTVMSFGDLSFCHLPIITQFRVSPDYSKGGSERNLDVICQGRESCVFSTLYEINKEMISFKVINSTNDIMYSRIMKDNGKNYACTEDCGHIDMETMKIKRNEKHLVLSLLNSHKKKRENALNKKNKTVKKNMTAKKNMTVKKNMTPKKKRHVKKIEKNTKRNIRDMTRKHRQFKNIRNIQKYIKEQLKDNKTSPYLFINGRKYILEQPLGKVRYRRVTTTLSFCKQLIFDEEGFDVDDK